MRHTCIRLASAAGLLAALSGTAHAHEGHGPHELWDTITHAFGAEQLLLLLGVGLGALVLRHWRGRNDHDKRQ